MRIQTTVSVLLAGSMIFAAGCNKKAPNKENFRTAIGNYYNAHPVCIWSSPVQFPVTVDPKDDSARGYDALTQAGLLNRQAQQKKEFIFSSKQVNAYDLSSKGRSAWTPDPNQPGSGNFCFGHRNVTQINNYTTSKDNSNDEIANVTYTYSVGDIADWAKSTEMMTAFPTIQADMNGTKVDQATLINSNDGWQVSHD